MSEANFRREMISKKDFNQTKKKFGTQSSNAKSERQREFGIIIIPKVRTCGS